MTDRYPLTWRIAHFTPAAYLALAFLFPIAALVPNNTASWTAWGALVALEVALIVPWAWHQRRLCGICASLAPLQGDAAAQRNMRLLNRFHNEVFLYCGLLPVIPLAVLTIWLNLPASVMRLGLSLTMIHSALMFQAANTHRLLQPWCPHCRRRRRWEDGGDPEPSPAPDPAPGARVPR